MIVCTLDVIKNNINDRDTFSELGDDMVGEIWVSSPSKAAGYFNTPIESKDCFRATLTSDDDDNNAEYLRTGDLGFLHYDELF